MKSIVKMKDALKKKGMFVKKLSNQGEFFRKRWEKEFASALSASQKKKIYMDQFLWHAFSYEKLPCLRGEQAIQAFEQQIKNDCYLLFEHDERVLQLSKCKHLTTRRSASDEEAQRRPGKAKPNGGVISGSAHVSDLFVFKLD